MSISVNFDEISVLEGFAKVSLDDLAANRSIYSIFQILNSLFSSNDENEWEEYVSLSFTSDFNTYAIRIDNILYMVDIDKKKFNFFSIENDVSDISFIPDSDKIVLLSAKKIGIYDVDYKYIKSFNNTYRIIKLIKTKKNLYGLSSSGLYSISIDNIEFKCNIENRWNKVFSFDDSLILLCSGQVLVINSQLSTISLSTSITNPVSASAIEGGSLIYVLDKENNVSIFKDYVYSSKVSVAESNHVFVWPCTDVIVCSNDVGVLYFYDMQGREIRSKHYDTNFIIRQHKNGFITLENNPVTNLFNLNLLSCVSDFDLYQRNCDSGFFAEALILQKKFNFDKDLYHKGHLRKFPPSKKLIEEHLMALSDKDYVVFYCKTARPLSFDIAKLLIDKGLEVKSNDEQLKIMDNRLTIFEKYNNKVFDPSEWENFRSQSLVQQLHQWISQGRYNNVALAIQYSNEITPEIRRYIFNSISIFVQPSEIEMLLPSDEEFYIKRANEIDEITGQTSLIVDLLRIGSSKNPSIKKLYESSREYDDFVSNASDTESVIKMSFQDFLNLSDNAKLHLYFGECRNGEEFSKALSCDHLKKLCIKMESLFHEFILDSVFGSPGIFSEFSFDEKFVQFAKILRLLNDDYSRDLTRFILNSLQKELDKKSITVIIEKWSDFMHTDIIQILKLFSIYSKYNTPVTFSKFANELNKEVVQKIIDSTIQDSSLSYDEWRHLYQLLLNLDKSLFANDSITHIIKASNIKALIRFEKWDDLDFENKEEVSIILDHVKWLIGTAETCDQDAPQFVTATYCLAMIKSTLASAESKEIFERLSRYAYFSKIDKNIRPTAIDSINNYPSLIITALQKQSQEFADILPKVEEFVKHFDLKMESFNDYLANLALKCNNFNTDINKIHNMCEDVTVNYLKNPNWKDVQQKKLLLKETMKTCSNNYVKDLSELLSDIISFPTLGDMSPEKRDKFILEFIINKKKEVALFTLRFLSKMPEKYIEENHRKLISKNPEKFFILIRELQKLSILNNKEAEHYISLIDDKASYKLTTFDSPKKNNTDEQSKIESLKETYAMLKDENDKNKLCSFLVESFGIPKHLVKNPNSIIAAYGSYLK